MLPEVQDQPGYMVYQYQFSTWLHGMTLPEKEKGKVEPR